MKDLYLISNSSKGKQNFKLSSQERILIQVKKFEFGCFDVSDSGDITLVFKVKVGRSALGISDFCNLYNDFFLALTSEGNLNFYMYEGSAGLNNLEYKEKENILGEQIKKSGSEKKVLKFLHEYFFDYHKHSCRYTSISTFQGKCDKFIVAANDEEYLNFDKRLILMKLNKKEFLLEKLNSIEFKVDVSIEPLFGNISGYNDIVLVKDFGIYDKIVKVRRSLDEEKLSVYVIKENKINHLLDVEGIIDGFRVVGLQADFEDLWVYSRKGKAKMISFIE